MSGQNFDVIIIGGGIIGASCAYELAKNNLKVAILEKRHIGSGASGCSAAMLEYQTDAWRGDKFLSLARPSIRLFPSLYLELKELTGVDFGFENCGILQLALSEEEAVNLENEVFRQNCWKMKSQWLTREELLDVYPQLTPDNFGGAFFEEDGQVVGERYTAAMARGALSKGVDFCEELLTEGVEKKGDKVLSIKTSKGIFSAEKFVLAAGAWSDEFLALLGVKLGIEPIRGQLVVYDSERRLIHHPVYTKSGGYITPKKEGYTLAGTTVEKTGFDETPTEEAKEKLSAIAGKILPRLARNKIRGMTAGLRPGSPDDLPILGALPGNSNFFLATGHYRSGILMAPITSQIIANLLEEKPLPVDISPFSPARFLGNSKSAGKTLSTSTSSI